MANHEELCEWLATLSHESGDIANQCVLRMTQLSNINIYRDLMESEIKKSVANWTGNQQTGFPIPFLEGLAIFGSDFFTLILNVATRSPQEHSAFSTASGERYYLNLESSDWNIRCLKAPLATDINVDSQLVEFDPVCIAPGEVCKFDQTTIPHPLDVHGRSHLLLLDKRSPPAYQWHFSASDLSASFCMLGTNSFSSAKRNLDWLIELSDELQEDHDVLPVLENYTVHTASSVRWAAIRAMCAVDWDVGKRHVLAAANDPAEEVAAMARRIVAREGLMGKADV